VSSAGLRDEEQVHECDQSHCLDKLQVKSLEALGKAIYLEVLELKKERERALESRTLAGHAKNFMGYMLSVYCLYK
jgi:golgi pH regulator